jgi:hypothetical protein
MTAIDETDGDAVGSASAQRGEVEDTIFVSIASYRDPQLGPTIDDCLAKARRPDRLTFGISWDHGPEEAPLDCFSDPAFRVLDVDWRESKGACWARGEIMKLWDNEKWFLQVDSHLRFVQDWDAKLLEQAAATGSPKPVLTSYGGSFVPGDPTSFSEEPMLLAFMGFDEGILMVKPAPMPNWRTSTRPVRSRFLGAMLLFAPGQFVVDVPYDPELYFWGEEITLAVRAFTHGYDLFHPGELIVWHEYTRAKMPKHWTDHVTENDVEEWWKRDVPSRRKVGRLLTNPKGGPFGFGVERTVADYEAYAGVSFAHRRVQEYTRRRLEPPNPPCGGDWAAKIRDYAVKLVIPVDTLIRPESTADSTWFVGFADSAGTELFRKDATDAEIRQQLLADSAVVVLERSFESPTRPIHWTVWPHSDSTGWGVKVAGELRDEGNDRYRGPAVGPEVDGFLRWYPLVEADIEWRQVEGGFVTRDTNDEAEPVLINNTGMFILELSDGHRSVSEITSLVGNAFGLAEPPLAVVAAFLDDAVYSGLVTLRRSESVG